MAVEVQDLTRSLELEPTFTTTELSAGTIVRLDCADSTRIARETTQRVKLPLGINLPHITELFDNLSQFVGIPPWFLQALTLSSRTIVNLAAITPKQFGKRAESEARDRSANTAIAVRNAMMIYGSLPGVIKVFSSGDGLEAILADGVDKEYLIDILPVILNDMVKIDGSPVTHVRIGTAEISAESKVTLLLDSQGNVVGGSGQPFIVAEKNERSSEQGLLLSDLAAKNRSKTIGDDNDPIHLERSSRISQYGELIADRVELSPHQDLAFVDVQVISPERFKKGRLPAEFEMQLAVARIFAKYNYQTKFGVILNPEAEELSTYLIPLRVDFSEITLKRHIESMRNIIKECQEIGVILQIAIAHSDVTITQADHSRKRDTLGHAVNYMARMAKYFGKNKKGKPILVCDRHTLEVFLVEEGWNIASNESETHHLKGFDENTEILNILEGDITPNELRTELESADFGETLKIADRILKILPRHFATRIETELFTYAGMLSELRMSKVNSITLQRYKALLLGIYPHILEGVELGEIVSLISELSLKYKFYLEGYNFIKSHPRRAELEEVFGFSADLVFGRDHPHREKTLRILLGDNYDIDQIRSILVEGGVITLDKEGDEILWRPNPAVAHFWYLTQSSSTREINHALITRWLYNESSESWLKGFNANNIDRFRSWLLHLGKDGKNLNPSTVERNTVVIEKGIDYMFHNKEYTDLCAIIGPIIDHYEQMNENRYVKFAQGLRIKLAYSLIRIGNFNQARKVLDEAPVDEENTRIDLYYKIIDAEPDKFEELLEYSGFDTEDYYLIAELFLERFNGVATPIFVQSLKKHLHIRASDDILVQKLIEHTKLIKNWKALYLLLRTLDDEIKLTDPEYFSINSVLQSMVNSPVIHEKAIATLRLRQFDTFSRSSILEALLNAGDYRLIEIAAIIAINQRN